MCCYAANVGSWSKTLYSLYYFRGAIWSLNRDVLYISIFLYKGIQLNLRYVIVWGCVSALINGHLHFLNDCINAETYIKILEQHLMPLIHHLLQAMHFTTRQCKMSWLRKKKWPASSIDLSSVENMWKILKWTITTQNICTKMFDMTWMTWHSGECFLLDQFAVLKKKCLNECWDFLCLLGSIKCPLIFFKIKELCPVLYCILVLF